MKTILVWGVVSALLLLCCGVVVNRAMDRGVHDELQFVAAGKLIARGLVPYRDFALSHGPYLAYVYAGLFTITPHLIFSARLFSLACVFALWGLLGALALRLFSFLPPEKKLSLGLCGVLFVFSSPFFLASPGNAWNHQFPTLLVCCAFFLVSRALRRQLDPRAFLVPGVLVGAAAGTRGMFFLAGGAFVLAIASDLRQDGVRVIKRFFWFCLGMALALVPLLVLYQMAPEQVLFGLTQGYNRDPTIYLRMLHKSPRGKFLLDQLFYNSTSFLQFLLFVGLSLRCAFSAALRRQPIHRHEFILIWGLVLLSLLGGVLPPSTNPQYFFPAPIFWCIGILYALAWLERSGGSRETIFLFCFVTTVVFILALVRDPQLLAFKAPSSWQGYKSHAIGVKIRSFVPRGKILTLSPSYVLEGNGEIYPEFAMGPFFWKISPYVPLWQRQLVRIAAAEDLDTLLEKDPPAAYLTGYEPKWDSFFIERAQRQGFRQVRIGHEKYLWIAPCVRGDDR